MMSTLRSTGYRFRAYTDADFPEVSRLWRDDAGWGELTPEIWRSWYVDIPEGPALIVVGEDDRGRIIAQASMTPCTVDVDGETCRAVHLAAPIVAGHLQRLQSIGPRHPVIRLLSACNAAATERGVQLIFAMPRKAWLPLLRLAPLLGVPRFPGAAFDCFERSLKSDAAALPDASVSTAQFDAFGAEHDELWEEARMRLPVRCGVRRHAPRLAFRNGGHLRLEIRHVANSRLLGIAVVRRDGLLVDWIARDAGTIEPLLASAWRFLRMRRSEGEERAPRSLKVMATPLLMPALDALRFERSRFQFGFVCRAIDGALRSRVTPDRWFLTPNG